MSCVYGPRPLLSCICVVLLAAGMPAGGAVAQTLNPAAQPLGLAEAERLALGMEPGRLALAAQAGALQARAEAAGALPEPMLRMGLNNYPFEDGSFTSEGMTNIGLGYRQVFPGGEVRDLRARQLQAQSGSLEQQSEARVREVRAAVRQAWLEAFYWQQARRLVAASRPYFSDLAEVTRSYYAAGRNSQQDVTRAELELSRLEDRLLDMQRLEQQARAGLLEWVGEDAYRALGAALPDWRDLPDLEELQAALAGHPQLRAGEAAILSWDAGVALADEQSRPDWALDLGYAYRNGRQPTGESRSDFISVNLSVELPFLQSRALDAQLRSAVRERDAAQARQVSLERSLRSRLAREYAQWTSLGERLELYSARVLPQSQAYVQAALLAYQSDDGDFADVMRARIDELNARLDYLHLQVQRHQAFAVLAELGGLGS